MYAAIYSADVQWETTEHTLTNSMLYSMNSTQMHAEKYRASAIFWIDHWIISKRMKQPLDHYVIVPDVGSLDRMSTTFWPYKYPLPPFPFHTQSTPKPF